MARADRTFGSIFVNLLGGFRVAGPAPSDALRFLRKKSQALLAMLALSPQGNMPRGKVTAVLWEEEPEAAARHRLRQCLLDLRQSLATVDARAISVQGDVIVLASSRLVVDATRFQQCAADGTPPALEEACRLYRGDLLDGFSLDAPAFDEWLGAERERLRSRAVAVMKALLTHYRKASNSAEAIQVALRLLALEPFDEAAHRALMRLYAESGRRSAALRQYEDCVELLARDLGVEPEAETRDLYRQLVARSAGLRSTRTLGPPEQIGGGRSRRPRFASPSPAETVMVGRKHDVAWLDELAERARRGQPQVALVFGEAGIGKSRLIGELRSRAQRRHAGVLIGRSREGEDVLPFAPWVEALRPALTRDLVNRLPVVTRTDLTRLFVEFAGPTPPPPAGLDDGPRIFEAVARLLGELSASRPMIVVLEDLHWCDDMTVRLLRFLPRRLEGRRVLLVGTARPEELVDDRDRANYFEVLRHDPACASRALPPLCRDDVKELFLVLAGRVDAPSGALVDRVWAISEGNPFVVVECARALRERRAQGGEGALDLPEGVRSLTARALVRLSERASRLVDVAAVIGRDFEMSVLRTAARLGPSAVADGLEELVRRRVLREMEDRFDFTHDRVRAVCYDRLLGPRRALLHQRVADALVAVYVADPTPHFAAIGTHYRLAGASAAACDYLARAGFQAWQRGAGREALVCFEDALHVIERLAATPERRALQVHLRIAANGAHVALGSYERGRPHLLAAETLAATLPDRRWEGLVDVVLCNSLRAGGMPHRALALGRRAVDIALEIEDPGLESAARLVLGATEENAGNLRRSFEQLLPLVNDQTSGPDLAGPFLTGVDRLQALRPTAHHWIAITCVELGEFATGLRLVRGLLQETDIVPDVLGTARMVGLIALGRLSKGFGDFEAAIEAYEAARSLYRDDCHVPFSRALFWGLGLAYALAGRIRDGIEVLENADAAERKMGSRSFRPMLMLHFGRALIEAGRLDDAEDRANEALTFAREDSNPRSEVGALGLLGEVAFRRRPLHHDTMESQLVDALRLSEAHDMRPLSARCHLRLAWLYQEMGRPDAERHEAAGMALLEQMGRPRSLDAAGVH